MDNWKDIKLGELLEEYSEKNLEAKYKPVAIGKYGIRKREEIYNKELSKDISNNKIIRKDTLTIGMGSKQIDIGILAEDEIYSVSPAYTTFKIKNCNTTFLKYYLNLINPQISNNYMIVGARQGKSVDKVGLLGHEIKIPPVEEQNKIASILSNVDEIIEKLEEEVKQEKKREQAIITKLLNNPKWKEEKMKDIVEYKKGFAFESKKYTKEGCRIIRVSDLTDVGIKDRKEAIYINKNEEKRYEDWKLNYNDIIITTVGSKPPIYNSMAGKVVRVPKEEEGSLLNQNNVRIRTKEGILQLYLYYYLKQEKYIYHIECIMRGNANQGNITVEELLEYKIKFPSIKEQKRIINVLDKIEEKIEMLQKNIKEYEKLRKGLMQKLLTGKIRVKN